MKKICLYAGTFNPFHKGHANVVAKSLSIFDEIWIVKMINYDKDLNHNFILNTTTLSKQILDTGNDFDLDRVKIHTHEGLLTDFIKNSFPKPMAIVRGLRNSLDFQYEKDQQYWYEDLGLVIPILYFICDRNLSHISSSALRQISKINTEHKLRD